MVAESLIEARRLSKTFGDDVAVSEIDLTVPAGSIFGFIGPSGCGKTTTVRLLNGTYEATSGQAIVFGRQPTKFRRQEQERIGYMPQLFSLYPTLSLAENLNFMGSLYGMARSDRQRRQKELLDLVELSQDKDKLARDVSGGMQRRLSLAAALMHEPDLIFLDEPTAGIDPILRRKLWDFFAQLKQAGKTLFVTTQYVGEATYCDYVGVMAEGKLLTIAPPDELRRSISGGDIIDITMAGPMPATQLYELKAHELVQNRLNFISLTAYRLTVEDSKTALPEILRWFESKQLVIESVSEYVLPFDDIFVEIIKRSQQNV